MGSCQSAIFWYCLRIIYHPKKEDQIEIAELFNTTPSVLEAILAILSNYRNLCAHEDIVFEHHTERVVPDNKYHQMMNIPKMDGEYIYGKMISLR